MASHALASLSGCCSLVLPGVLLVQAQTGGCYSLASLASSYPSSELASFVPGLHHRVLHMPADSVE